MDQENKTFLQRAANVYLITNIYKRKSIFMILKNFFDFLNLFEINLSAWKLNKLFDFKFIVIL